MSVRLYGRAVGHGSLSVVTSGFREALSSAGLLEGFVALDKSGGDEEQDAPPGALARDGVFTGNLNLVPLMRRGAQHERHWVQVTPNSTYVPQNLLNAVLNLPNPRILSASAWGSTVIAQALCNSGFAFGGRGLHGDRYVSSDKVVSIYTVRHGVTGFAPVPAALESARADFAQGKFRVIHFSTTDGERKGTLELVQAWSMLMEHSIFPRQAELLLVLDYHANMALRQRLEQASVILPNNVRILSRGDFDAATMSEVLCRMHLVATPSRGEGFGLLPLQARACGVPVATTVTMGHSAGHCGPPEPPGVVTIAQSGELAPIDDGPGALAPRVSRADIASAILRAHRDWVELSAGAEQKAPEVARHWSWQTQLAPLVQALR